MFKHPPTLPSFLLKLLLLVCLSGGTGFSQTAQAQTQPPHALELGQVVEQDITADETHVYEFSVDAGQFIQIVSRQAKLRASLKLFDPAGKLLSSLDDIVGGVTLDVRAIAAQAGRYRIEFRAFRNQPAGHYQLQWVAARTPTERERLTLSIETSMQTVLTYNRNGQYAAALPVLEQMLADGRRLQPPAPAILVDILNRIGLAASRLGEFVQAERAFQEAIQLAEQQLDPSHFGLAEALEGLANLYIVYGGNYALAANYLQRALVIEEKNYGAESGPVASTLHSLGNLYFGAKDYDRAEATYQRVVNLFEKQPSDVQLKAMPLAALGRIAQLRGQFEQAETYLQNALGLLEKMNGRDHPTTALTIFALGKLAQERGQLSAAAAFYERAYQIFLRSRGAEHVNTIEILEAQAQLKLLQNEVSAALPYQMKALAAAQRNLSVLLSGGSEQQRRNFLALYAHQTDVLLTLHLRLAPNEPAVRALAATTLLQRKGLVQETFANTLANLRRRLDPAAQQTLEQWQTVSGQLARLVLDGPRPRTSAEAHQQQIEALATQRDQLETELSRRSPGAFQSARAVTLAEIQAALPAQSALLEFAVYRPFDPKAPAYGERYGAPRYAVYLLRAQGEIAWCELGDAAALDAAINAWRAALRDPKRRDAATLGQAVSARLFKPLQPLLKGVEHLLISPDGLLNLIPFEALPESAEHYLLERYTISYLTSGRDLLRQPSPASAAASAKATAPLVLADPLFGEPPVPAQSQAPTIALRRRSVTSGNELKDVYFAPLFATAHEARTIKTLFKDASVLTGAQATEAALKQAQSPQLLHIATHGFFLADTTSQPITQLNPLLRSGLALAQANLRRQNTTGEDGILTALEAAGLNLWGTRLVTLSACDTGLGEVRNGEGVYGLRRAFTLAGAETLVMSLWPVSDQVTRELMTAFYTNLQQGQGRAAALRAAQLQLLKRPNRRAPYYWASFIQAGEWGNLNGQR